MKVAVFDTHKFDRTVLEKANAGKHVLRFLEVRLNSQTAVLADGCDAVCCFTNDKADAAALQALKGLGVRLIALRSAGYNHVDLRKAAELGLTVVRVPEYSPYAVAEHAVALLLCLNRKIHKAHNRIHDLNFSLDGLLGFDLHGKSVGVIGTGRIGKAFAQIMHGFGCKLFLYDKFPDQKWAAERNAKYVDRQTLAKECDVLSLHVPLSEETKHFIDHSFFSAMKKTAILVNTGRGALIDTKALLESLKSRSIGGAALDVYEEEEGVFFSDFSETGIDDDLLARLITFPNVLITSHQGFFTQEALKNIAETTISNLTLFETNQDLSAVKVSAPL